jgi:hypothetical protein
MSTARVVFATATRPFSTKKKRAARKAEPLVINYNQLFAFIPVNDK